MLCIVRVLWDLPMSCQVHIIQNGGKKQKGGKQCSPRALLMLTSLLWVFSSNCCLYAEQPFKATLCPVQIGEHKGPANLQNWTTSQARSQHCPVSVLTVQHQGAKCPRKPGKASPRKHWLHWVGGLQVNKDSQGQSGQDKEVCTCMAVCKLKMARQARSTWS